MREIVRQPSDIINSATSGEENINIYPPLVKTIVISLSFILKYALLILFGYLFSFLMYQLSLFTKCQRSAFETESEAI